MSEDRGRGVLVGAKGYQAHYTGGSRRGFTPGQYDELRLDRDHVSEVILVPGKYKNRFFSESQNRVIETVDPFYHYVRHGIPPQFQRPSYAQGNKTFDGRIRWAYLPCSRQPDGTGECIPCSIPSNQLKGKTRFVYTVIHLAPYHRVPSKKEGQTYPKLCLEPYERDCPGCRAGHDVVPAARRWLGMSNLDWEILEGVDKGLSQQCACGGKLRTTELVCSACNDTLIKRSAENKEVFRKARQEGRFYCRRCGIPVQVAEWRTCSDCGNPRPQSMFNMLLGLKTVQKETYSQLSVVMTKPAGELIDQLKAYAEPLDLAAIFSPLTLKEQREVISENMGDPGFSEPR